MFQNTANIGTEKERNSINSHAKHTGIQGALSRYLLVAGETVTDAVQICTLIVVLR